MKKNTSFLVFCLCSVSLFSQVDTGSTIINKSEAKDLKEAGYKINSKILKFGATLGFNYLTKTIYDPTLSIVDSTLRLDPINPVSFLVSTSVVINPIKAYYRKLDPKTGKPIGNVYTVPSRLSFVATVNIAHFGLSATGEFNKKIDGGLGLGLQLNDDFHLALTAEMISVRQPRDYIMDYKDKQILIDHKPLSALDQTDNRIFVDKYYFGLSIKFVYILTGKESKE